MKLPELQQRLKDTRRYGGAVDGIYGRLTDAGILLALTDGPDTVVTLEDMANAAKRIGVQTAAIRAFWKVEANGAGFQGGRPKILPEPHRFSKNTGGRFDLTNPTISYPKWGARPYPSTQDARYDVLLAWVRLLAGKSMDLDAAFASASYGAPQIMGENAELCGYADAFAFAEAMARDEATQLDAFIAFVDHAGILPSLRLVDRSANSWAPVARRYNGSAYAANRYHEKMAAAFAAFGGR
jgi:hypothetical protein